MEKHRESAWIFQAIYAFLSQAPQSKGICPAGADSAIWLYQDPQWVHQDASCSLLRFEMPRNRILTFDLRLWNRVLNLEYLGESLQDEIHFHQELERLSLTSTLLLFQTPFYPLQKRKVQYSWNRIFRSRVEPEIYLQAAVWELRWEWLIECP